MKSTRDMKEQAKASSCHGKPSVVVRKAVEMIRRIAVEVDRGPEEISPGTSSGKTCTNGCCLSSLLTADSNNLHLSLGKMRRYGRAAQAEAASVLA